MLGSQTLGEVAGECRCWSAGSRRMKCYFVTIPDTAVLTLQAGAMGQGGEIFVLDMGEPMHIVDLAKR